MPNMNYVLDLAKKNNGIVSSAMITAAGISRGTLKYMVEQGTLILSSRGVYTLPGSFSDEMYELQTRLKRGIFSHETALFLFDLTDQTPIHYTMSFPKGYNLSNAKQDDIRCIQRKKEIYEIGICEVMSPGGNLVKVYNKEKTLCDILRPQAKTNIQIIADAFKRYSKLKDKNIPLLSEYARKFGVEEKVRSYLEVLL